MGVAELKVGNVMLDFCFGDKVINRINWIVWVEEVLKITAFLLLLQIFVIEMCEYLRNISEIKTILSS